MPSGRQPRAAYAIRLAARPTALRDEHFYGHDDCADASMPIDYFVWLLDGEGAGQQAVLDGALHARVRLPERQNVRRQEGRGDRRQTRDRDQTAVAGEKTFHVAHSCVESGQDAPGVFGDLTTPVRGGLHAARRAAEQAPVQTLLHVGYRAPEGGLREAERFGRGREAAVVGERNNAAQVRDRHIYVQTHEFMPN